MPVRGAKQKSQAASRSQTRRVHDWVEVENVPYAGESPELPETRRAVLPFGEVIELPIHEMTRRWWESVRSMPHCRLWSDSDWTFALATALVADAFYYGHNPSASELARREKVMGVTVDSRRDLRIRYVEPVDEKPASVTSLDDYRDL